MARAKRKNAHPRDCKIQGSRSWKKIDYIVGYNDLEKSWFAYSKAWFGLLWGRSEKEIVTKARKRIDKHLAPSYPYPRKRKNPAPGNYFESCKKKLSQAIDRQVIKILKSKEFKGIEDARKDDHFGIAFLHRGDTYYLAITAFQKLNLRDHAVARVILYRDDYLRQLTKIWEKEEVEVEGDNKGAHMGWSIISAIPTRITTKWRTQGRANPRKRKNSPKSKEITRKSDLKPDKRYTLWLRMTSGYFVIERSYYGGYIKDALWDDMKTYNKSHQRQYALFPENVDPNARANPRKRKSLYPDFQKLSDTAKETVYVSQKHSCMIRVRHHFPHRPVLWECADGRHGEAKFVPEAIKAITKKSNPRKRKNPDAESCTYPWYTIRRGFFEWFLTPKYSIPKTRFASSQVEYSFPTQAEAKRQGRLYAKEVEHHQTWTNPRKRKNSQGMTGVLRAGYFPKNKYGGTQLFLMYENGSYVVRSRFQQYYRSRKVKPNTKKGRETLARATKKFEDLLYI